jgi:hypothetical protein
MKQKNKAKQLKLIERLKLYLGYSILICLLALDVIFVLFAEVLIRPMAFVLFISSNIVIFELVRYIYKNLKKWRR